MSVPYGAQGCSCWPSEEGVRETWLPNARCRYHGLLADYLRDRMETGQYRVVSRQQDEMDVPYGRTPQELSRDEWWASAHKDMQRITEQEQDERPGLRAAIRRWWKRHIPAHFHIGHDDDGW
jgi:hypothetical protein